MAKGRPIINNYSIEKLELETKIDYDKLAQAINKASADLDVQREKDKAERNAKILKKRNEILNEQDFSHIKCRAIREIKTFFNSIEVAYRFLTLSRENAQHFSTLKGLTRMLTTSLVFLIEIAFYALALGLLGMAFLGKILALYCVVFSILFAVFGRLIRLARFEIERMEDDSQLMNIAMMVIALITLIATIIGIIVSTLSKGG